MLVVHGLVHQVHKEDTIQLTLLSDTCNVTEKERTSLLAKPTSSSYISIARCLYQQTYMCIHVYVLQNSIKFFISYDLTLSDGPEICTLD